ncbi:VrrA/YqfQ family protein [Niallia sp. 01092]|uniref:VrrA/YqfQ family protein n=1 Tax=unclassified Niallia TaxID=2837522 RepID=UPI003FD661A7
MPPRPRIPYQRGMMGGRMMQQVPPNFRNPMMGRGGAPTRNGGGGILSKLLGRNNRGAAANAAGNVANAGARSASSGGGILKAITNPASINGFLANSQKFLNTASQIGPMINQYGPMVRNIPAMWKLYRGLKNADFSNEDTSNAKDTPTKKEKTPKKTTSKHISVDDTGIEEWETTDAPERTKGPSVPKMYI